MSKDSITTKTKTLSLKVITNESNRIRSVSIPTITIKSSPTTPKQVKSGQSDSKGINIK